MDQKDQACRGRKELYSDSISCQMVSLEPVKESQRRDPFSPFSIIGVILSVCPTKQPRFLHRASSMAPLGYGEGEATTIEGMDIAAAALGTL